MEGSACQLIKSLLQRLTELQKANLSSGEMFPIVDDIHHLTGTLKEGLWDAICR